MPQLTYLGITIFLQISALNENAGHYVLARWLLKQLFLTLEHLVFRLWMYDDVFDKAYWEMIVLFQML